MFNESSENNEISINGTVKRVIYNKEGMISVIFSFIPDDDFDIELITDEDSFVVKGEAGSIKAGMPIEITGEFITDPNYGKQFKASVIIPAVLNNAQFDAQAMVNYLSSGIVIGITEFRARKIVEAFGQKTEEVLRLDPIRLSRIKGISQKLAISIQEQWIKNKEVHGLFKFLSKHGMSLGKCTAVYEQYGERTLALIKENPYLLSEVEGIGFKTADSLALSSGLSKTSPKRIENGINFFFKNDIIDGDGSTGTDIGTLLAGASKILSIPMQVILSNVNHMIATGIFTQEEDGIIYAPSAYAAERGIAHNIGRLFKYYNNDPEKLNNQIAKAEKACEIELSESQRQAIKEMLSGSVSVLTGMPGTGKTTILKVLLHIMESSGHKVGACSPTGKAAQRMEEAMLIEATTIHRLLEVSPDGGFVYNRHNKLDLNLVIVDEVSMGDVFILNSLLSALPEDCKLMLIGDIFQFPSVGAGRVLGDIIDSGTIPVAILTEIRRQGSGSAISLAAKEINEGRMPKFTNDEGDFTLKKVLTPEDGLAEVIDLVVNKLPSKGVRADDIQVLAPMKMGACGTISINQELQKRLNPNSSIDGKFIKIMDRKIALGDKVIQMKNNRKLGIYNGDTGKVVDIDIDKGEIKIDFAGKGVITIPPALASKIELFYAGTVHKSQGSEYPHVVMPLFTSHFRLLQRNLFYTAITRGRNKVHTITDPEFKAVKIALRTQDSNTRVTSLKSHLEKTLPLFKVWTEVKTDDEKASLLDRVEQIKKDEVLLSEDFDIVDDDDRIIASSTKVEIDTYDGLKPF